RPTLPARLLGRRDRPSDEQKRRSHQSAAIPRRPRPQPTTTGGLPAVMTLDSMARTIDLPRHGTCRPVTVAGPPAFDEQHRSGRRSPTVPPTMTAVRSMAVAARRELKGVAR